MQAEGPIAGREKTLARSVKMISCAARSGFLPLIAVWLVAGIAPQAAQGAAFPLEVEGGHPTVPVRIGEHGPFDFILDTGAAVTLIDESLARELELPVVGETTVGSPLEEDHASRATVALTGVTVAELALPRFEAVLMDLAALFGSSDGPRGVLSAGAFTGHLVSFDYPAGRVEIAPGELPEADGLTIWEYPAEATLPELPLVVAGRPAVVHVDSGSPGEITLPLEMATELPLAAEPVVVGRGAMVDRAFDIYAAALDGAVTLGAIRIDRPRLGFIAGIPCGNVGIRFLRNRVLTVDPAHHRLRLVAGMSAEEEKPATAPGQPKRYGIRFFLHDDGPMPVAGVDEGSPAHVAGLRAGDQIIEINNRPVEELDSAERVAAFHSSPLRLVVLRGKERLVLTMTLE
jgi:hypothetical protein